MSSISRLNIEQQRAVFEIHTTPAQMHITTPRPQMRIIQERPEMSVDRQRPRFTINREKINAESGLRPPLNLSQSIAGNARMDAQSGTTETVQDGNYLGKVEQPGNRVAQLSRRKSLKNSLREINIANMPKSSPEVEWDPGYIRINWSNHKFQIEWEGEYMPELVIDPNYSVEIIMRNRPSIIITVEEDSVPFEAGQRVDETF